ncbi:MAG TPA: ribbon-helix-helix protein, CopG family [Chloroflexota bacterium]|jgi:metal-responsive CopG/Arc/MetJ family transcriptional regulator|nr:ribbon-helix-helix protein, CopG family [Chloroflexota bacterium]
MPSGVTRTTLTLPTDLLKEADRVVRQGGARSRNELLAEALRRELAVRERAEIDAAFAAMADDADYQAEVEQLSREFARSDWEAFQEAEKRP